MDSYRSIVMGSVFTWLKIGITKIIFSLVCIVVGVGRLFTGISGDLKFSQYMEMKSWAIALVLLSVGAIVLYVLFANRAFRKRLVGQMWSQKVSNFLVPKIHSYFAELPKKCPGWVEGLTSSKFAKMLVDVVTEDGALNKIQRLVVVYGIKRIKIGKSDLEVGEENEQNLLQLLVVKFDKGISETLEYPSGKNFGILFGIQFTLFVLAVILA